MRRVGANAPDSRGETWNAAAALPLGGIQQSLPGVIRVFKIQSSGSCGDQFLRNLFER